MRDRQGFKRAISSWIDGYENNVRGDDFLALRQTVKDIIKAEIARWMADNSLEDCHNRIEFKISGTSNWRGEKHSPIIRLGYCSLFSSKGGIGKHKWLNKITVSRQGIISHVARTDERFLGLELPENFKIFLNALEKEANDISLEAWGEYNLARI